MENKKKIIKIIAIIIAISLVAFLAYFIYLQTLVARGELIKFNDQWYKKADWQAIFGEYDTLAKNTPEEVYTAFRQALLDGDKEKALGLIRVEKREGYKEVFGDEERIKLYLVIPEISLIKKHENDSFGNYAVYSYYIEENIGDVPFFIDFIKNREGYWEIDSI